MSIPIRAFWMMANTIDRIEAQQDLRKLTISVTCQGQEAAQNHRERLILEVGEVVKLNGKRQISALPNAERDEVGFAELKAMAIAMGTAR